MNINARIVGQNLKPFVRLERQTRKLDVKTVCQIRPSGFFPLVTAGWKEDPRDPIPQVALGVPADPAAIAVINHKPGV